MGRLPSVLVDSAESWSAERDSYVPTVASLSPSACQDRQGTDAFRCEEWLTPPLSPPPPGTTCSEVRDLGTVHERTVGHLASCRWPRRVNALPLTLHAYRPATMSVSAVERCTSAEHDSIWPFRRFIVRLASCDQKKSRAGKGPAKSDCSCPCAYALHCSFQTPTELLVNNRESRRLSLICRRHRCAYSSSHRTLDCAAHGTWTHMLDDCLAITRCTAGIAPRPPLYRVAHRRGPIRMKSIKPRVASHSRCYA